MFFTIFLDSLIVVLSVLEFLPALQDQTYIKLVLISCAALLRAVENVSGSLSPDGSAIRIIFVIFSWRPVNNVLSDAYLS